MITVEHKGAGEILAPLAGEIDALHERWSGKTLRDVYAEKPLSEHVDIGEAGHVEVVTLDAVDDYDGTDVVLPLPYLQGFTAHHYIRGRTAQELVFPHSRLHILPSEPDSVTLSDADRERLARGDGGPIAEKQMKALEKKQLGETALTGYSWGALDALELLEAGSDQIEINRVNADELPNESNRDDKKLRKDFARSGTVMSLRAAITEADIPALSEAMNLPRMALDIAQFGLRSLGKDGKLLARPMTGSHNWLIIGAVKQLGADNVKIGSIKGSTMFSYGSFGQSKVEHNFAPRVVSYGGSGFHSHATADNVIIHAAMIKDGLS